jgi:hypothetical protein
MSWFSKKNKKESEDKTPSIVEPPKLPELPRMNRELDDLPKLPSYPSDALGKKFSDEAIKNIVSGEKLGDKVGDYEGFIPNESLPRNIRTKMEKLPQEFQKIKTKSFQGPRTQETEPVFVRMDKFEESLEIFEKAKKQISEIEKFLEEIKSTREKEEVELQEWEKEMQMIKSQFEKIDRNLFSKI